jgi:crotonobetainyl-CoA:carnitine CoA-transferase CaiB-like acyl-CoA transferase
VSGPVTLNLKTEEGRALLREMAAKADILIENFAPGVMDRLGVGPADLQMTNPHGTWLGQAPEDLARLKNEGVI